MKYDTDIEFFQILFYVDNKTVVIDFKGGG